MQPTFFATPADWRAWLDAHHADRTELLVGFYKKDSGKPSITWPESVDQALCYGWIDGVRRGIDAESYSIRFTPRKTTSNWSNVNINRIQELDKLGLVQPAGLAAFAARKAEKSGIYAYEQTDEARLSPDFQKQFEANKTAWKNFQAMVPSYQKAAKRWVMRAKQDTTQARRLAQLIDCAEQNTTVPPLTPRIRKYE